MQRVGRQDTVLPDGEICIAGKFIESSTTEAYDALAKGLIQEFSFAAA
jgi:hypothetical protein